MAAAKRSLTHIAYVVTVAIKGFDGGVETLAGLVIWLTGPQRLYRWVVRITAPELYDGEHVRAVHAIRRGAEHLATTGAHFVVLPSGARHPEAEPGHRAVARRRALDIPRRHPDPDRLHCLHELPAQPAMVELAAG